MVQGQWGLLRVWTGRSIWHDWQTQRCCIRWGHVAYDR